MLVICKVLYLELAYQGPQQHQVSIMQVLLNQKLEPLLQSANANNTKSDPRVLLKFQPGTAMVPLRLVLAARLTRLAAQNRDRSLLS